MVSTKIVPTDRSMPAVMTTSACAMATRASSVPLFDGGIDDIGGQPGLMIGDVDNEHDDEDRHGDQRAALLRQPVAPILHARTSVAFPPGMLRALATSACSVISSPGKLASDGAVVEDQNPVAAADQLVIVRRIEQDRGASIGEAAQQPVKLLLGANIDAACRIVEQNDARLAHQPFGDHDLLLVAA